MIRDDEGKRDAWLGWLSRVWETLGVDDYLGESE